MIFLLSNGVEALALFLFALNCSKGKIAPGSQGLALTPRTKKTNHLKVITRWLSVDWFLILKKIKFQTASRLYFSSFVGNFVKEKNLNPFPLDDP